MSSISGLPGLIGASLCALAGATWIAAGIAAFPHRRRTFFLADLPPDEPAGGWPRLAVIVPARDEAASVEIAMRSLLGQDYPALRVVAVDDRSRDGTGEILDRLARADDRLQVLHVELLPDGWLGKTHALQAGLDAIDAEWALFTDGDVVFAPGALRAALAHAVRHELDHLTVIPDVVARSVGEKLFLTIFGLLFVLRAPPWRVERPDDRAFIGAGAFNLARVAPLRRAGGFGPIALSVDEDVRLGQLLKWNGGRASQLFGNDAVAVRWQVGIGGMIGGLEKNFLAVIDFRFWLVAPMAAFILWVGAAPHVGLFFGPWWARAACAGGIAVVAGLLQQAGPRGRIAPAYALALPAAALLLVAALSRSVWATLRQRGIRWRERVYPLTELRAHVRARNAWMRAAWRRGRAGSHRPPG